MQLFSGTQEGGGHDCPQRGQGVLMLRPVQEGCGEGTELRGASLSGELGSLLKTKYRSLVDSCFDGALFHLLCFVGNGFFPAQMNRILTTLELFTSAKVAT